jgi:beta-1,2-mannobiose phosphorylase / 1,2-beta-oligomannan phosphorylase
MVLVRSDQNPLLTPRDVQPSRPDFEVIGVFNAGVTTFGDEILLLLRVAERPIQTDPGQVLFPQMAADGQLTVQAVARGDSRYDASDPRLVRDLQSKDVTLTSISHIRLARSSNGLHFKVDDQPWLSAEPPYESFGVEDARVSQIDGVYYVNYSAVSPYGISTSLAATRDFEGIDRYGVILPPSNRDVVIFPEKIDRQYVCYHRPMPSLLGRLNIWIATSPDLRHWGEHRIVLESGGGWESGRVGGGAPPIRTERGWLSIYHAADPNDRYCLGAFLTPLDEPSRVIARSRQPILVPAAPYETNGFFPNVVFTCGALLRGDELLVYYGASDDVIALARSPLEEVLSSLQDQM